MAEILHYVEESKLLESLDVRAAPTRRGESKPRSKRKMKRLCNMETDTVFVLERTFVVSILVKRLLTEHGR